MTVTTTIIYRHRIDILYDKKIAQQCNDIVTVITSCRMGGGGGGGQAGLAGSNQ